MTGRFRALGVLHAALLAAMPAATHADRLASYSDAGGDVALMTEGCGPGDSQIQRAVKSDKGRRLAGCWVANGRGTVVVLWGDGSVQELDETQIKLTPKYLAALRKLDALTAKPEEPAPSTSKFQRALWCKDATFAHERLICRDPALAQADLQLAPLWRAYREEMKLSKAQEQRVKSDYFKRLKSCGSRRACIAREQATQMKLYREALKPR